MHLNVVELFSGIGSQARALDNIGIEKDVLATCEWDIHAFIAYDVLHEGVDVLPEVSSVKDKDTILRLLEGYTLSNNGKEAMTSDTLRTYSIDLLKRIYSAIKRTKNLVDISKVSGSDMPDNIDLMTYSFPCQDLSNVGAFHHYNKGIDINSGSRSSLLWQVGRILDEMKYSGKKLPGYLVMENVPTLLSSRHIKNFEKWISDLGQRGYLSQYVQVNARNYGIPQNRPRLLMLSVYVGEDKEKSGRIKGYLDLLDEKKITEDYIKSEYYHPVTVGELLRIPSAKGDSLWEEALACTPNDTPSRRTIWNGNPKIINEAGELTRENFIRTITTKQDRHPNSGNIYFRTGISGRADFRYLTPRECMLFMGFTDKDYEKLTANNPESIKNHYLFTRDKIIRMAGNSIPVNMLEGFFYQLYKIDKLLKNG